MAISIRSVLLIIVATEYFCVVLAQAQKKFKLSENKDEISALLIFNDHGISDRRHVCKSIDGVTPRTYGDPVCKHAAESMFPGESITERAECVEILLPSGKYKHGTRVGNFRRNQMAKCKYGDEDTGFFLVLNAPKDHYYVFTPGDDNANVQIKAVLHITLSDSDFPNVELGETTDPKEVDTIYGLYGTITMNDKGRKTHVCAKTKGMYTVGNDICKKILETEYMTSKNRAHIDVPIKCESKNIRRERISRKTNKHHIAYGIFMAKCHYTINSITGGFMFFNGPTENLYYIVDTDPTHRGIWAFKALLEIT